MITKKIKLARFVPEPIVRFTGHRANAGTPFSVLDEEDLRDTIEPRWVPSASGQGEKFIWVEPEEADFIVVDVAINWQNYIDGVYESTIIKRSYKFGRLGAVFRIVLSRLYRPFKVRKLRSMMKMDKPLVVVDFSDPVDIPPFITNKDILFKTSLLDYCENIIPSPYFVKPRDIAEFSEVEYDVSFCGSINSHPVRKRAINSLRQGMGSRVFVLESPKWWGKLSSDEQHKWRVRFNESIKKSLLILAPRGGGVSTFRMYEAMAYGRIPIIVGSDKCLAFPDLIPWKDICFCVPDNMIDHVDQFCCKIFQDHSREELEEKARKCHEYFKKYLAPNVLISTYCYYLRIHLEKLML